MSARSSGGPSSHRACLGARSHKRCVVLLTHLLRRRHLRRIVTDLFKFSKNHGFAKFRKEREISILWETLHFRLLAFVGVGMMGFLLLGEVARPIIGN